MNKTKKNYNAHPNKVVIWFVYTNYTGKSKSFDIFM